MDHAEMGLEVVVDLEVVEEGIAREIDQTDVTDVIVVQKEEEVDVQVWILIVLNVGDHCHHILTVALKEQETSLPVGVEAEAEVAV